MLGLLRLLRLGFGRGMRRGEVVWAWERRELARPLGRPAVVSRKEA